MDTAGKGRDRMDRRKAEAALIQEEASPRIWRLLLARGAERTSLLQKMASGGRILFCGKERVRKAWFRSELGFFPVDF